MRYLLRLLTFLLLASVPAFASSGTIDLNVRNADLSSVLDLIATQSGINIVVDGSTPTKTVTLRLHNIPLRDALLAIEQAYGISGTWQNGVLHLGAPADVNRSYPSGNGVSQFVYTLHNAKAVTLGNVLTAMLPDGTIIAPDQTTNTIFIKGSPSAVATAKQIITSIDQSQRYGGRANQSVVQTLSNLKASDALALIRSSLQVAAPNSIMANDVPNNIVISGSTDFIASVRGLLFDLDRPGHEVDFRIRVTDVTPINDNSDIGILFGGATIGGSQTAGNYSTATEFVNNAIQVNATLNLLVSKGDAKILAEPTLAALNNQPATLNLGEQYPIVYFDAIAGTQQVQFVNAGVIIKITPQVGDDGTITANMDVEYSQILSFVQNYPVIGQREATTTMKIGDNQAIVIAGLFSDVQSDTVTKIPWLSDIPIIGGIFKNRVTNHTRDEIVFLVEPHIVTPADFQKMTPTPSPIPCPRNTSEIC